MSSSVTATDLITRALSILGVVGAGQTPAAEDMATGLDGLNTMLDSWQAEKRMVYAIQNAQAIFSPNQASCTVGVGQQLNITRPNNLPTGIFFTANGYDYQCPPQDYADYDALFFKTMPAIYPQLSYYDAQSPVANIYLWPVPVSGGTLTVPLDIQLTRFADLVTAYTLPDGYKRAFIFSLAEELASDFDRNMSDKELYIARKARGIIKLVNNNKHPELSMPSMLIRRPGWFNINTGGQ